MRGALIVGIDDYPIDPLSGCVNDARDVANLLKHHEDEAPNFDVNLVVSENNTITRSLLNEKIEMLFSIKEDLALFYYSGHGTENNLEGYIVTPEAKNYEEGIPVSRILELANHSPSTERIVILDSCHSGHLGNLPDKNNMATIREGVTILTSSKGNQTSLQRTGSSIFTSLLLDALDGGAADVLGKVNIASIYSYIDKVLGFFEQRPLYKSHVTKLVSIRDCKPVIEIELLRKLGGYFTARDALHQLRRSYEKSCTAEFNPEHGKIFTCLQLSRAAGLVEPIPPTIHMYDAAINEEPCRLTRLGKYYWHLAKKGRL